MEPPGSGLTGEGGGKGGDKGGAGGGNCDMQRVDSASIAATRRSQLLQTHTALDTRVRVP